jgi:hypothetical protein
MGWAWMLERAVHGYNMNFCSGTVGIVEHRAHFVQ